MKKIIMGISILIMAFILAATFGCGSQVGGGGTGSQDVQFILQQLDSMIAGLKNENANAFFAPFSDYSGVNKNEIIGQVQPYLNSMEVSDNTSETYYTSGTSNVTVHYSGSGSAPIGTTAEVTGRLGIYANVKTTMPVAIPAGNNSNISINVPVGTCVNGNLLLPFIFTKEAETGTASDWRLWEPAVEFGQVGNDTASLTRLFTLLDAAFVGTIPGIQSAGSFTALATVSATATVPNEQWITGLITTDATVPYITAGVAPGLDANTNYTNTYSIQYPWANKSLSHRYKTNTAVAGSNTVSGTLSQKTTTTGRIAGVYLIPWDTVSDLLGGLMGSSISSASIVQPNDFIWLAICGVGGSIASTHSDALVGTDVTFEFTNVPDGAYTMVASEMYSDSPKVSMFGLSQSGPGNPSFEVTGNVSGIVLTMEATSNMPVIPLF